MKPFAYTDFYNLYMIVYIEYAVINNLVIDIVICIVTLKSLNMRLSFWRIALASAMGTAAAVLSPVLKLQGLYFYLIKGICGIIMSLIICKGFEPRKIIKTILCFFFVTFALGGACIGILYLVGENLSGQLTFTYTKKLPIGIIVSALTLAVFFIARHCYALSRKRHMHPYFRDCVISIYGKEFRLKGFIDSGNTLFDENNLPVVVMSGITLKKLADQSLYTKLLINEAKGNHSKLEYRTAAGIETMSIIKPDFIKIYSGKRVNKIYDVKIGLAAYEIGGDNFQVLLHPSFA